MKGYLYEKKHVLLLVLASLLLGVASGYMVGKIGGCHFSSDSYPYTQRINIGNLVLFTDNEGANFLVMRCAEQGGQKGYRWLLTEETMDNGTIQSTYYGPNSPLVTKSPLLGPISDWVCTVRIVSEDVPTPIFCQLGKFPNGNIFIDKNNDGSWDTWHDCASGIYYIYNDQKFGWEKTE